jgi:hypothetical protein
MKISYIQGHDVKSTETRITFNLISKFIENKIPVLINDCDDTCDYILCMNGLSQHSKFREIVNKYPHKKKIMYVWDLYPWTSYARGHEDLNNYNEIWVPSNEVILRLKEIYNVDPNKCKVIRAYADFFEDEDNKLCNNGYVYHFARHYNDPNAGFCEKASNITNIQLVKSSHNLSFEKYKETILKCSFLVLDYMEASTGGLTLLEGYYHGKDILVSDSIYQGARDYFGDRIFYFKDGDIDDYIKMYKFMYERSSSHGLSDYEKEERKTFCKDNFSIDVFTNNILQSLKKVK